MPIRIAYAKAPMEEISVGGVDIDGTTPFFSLISTYTVGINLVNPTYACFKKIRNDQGTPVVITVADLDGGNTITLNNNAWILLAYFSLDKVEANTKWYVMERRATGVTISTV